MSAIRQQTDAVLEHIRLAVSAHQIPDLTLLKSLHMQRERQHQEQLNALFLRQEQCLRRGEAAAMSLYQRHQYQTGDVMPQFEPATVMFNQQNAE